MAKQFAEAWDVRLVKETRWWMQPFQTYREAYLILRWNGTLVMMGTCEKGFGFVLDNNQWKGDKVAKKIEDVTFRIDAKGNRNHLFHVMGRKTLNGVKLNSFKALAYIFELTGWQYADADQLLKHTSLNQTKDDNDE